MGKQLLILDCDSTLTSIEGVDELARLKGEAVFQASEALTNQAMDGEVAVEDVFGKRLQLIQPSLEHCLRVGESYIEEVEPTALELVRAAREAGWDLIILSGGFTKVIGIWVSIISRPCRSSLILMEVTTGLMRPIQPHVAAASPRSSTSLKRT